MEIKLKNIETKRFILRQVTFEDKNDIFEILNDDTSVKYLNLDRHIELKDTEKLLKDYLIGLEEKTKFPYAIIEKDTLKFVGVFLVKIDLYNDNAYEFTIYLNKAFWGKGVYSEILPYMIMFAFEEVKTKNFRGYAMEKNIASIKVLEKSGFNLEKTFNLEGFEDTIYSYLITEKDYLEMRRNLL